MLFFFVCILFVACGVSRLSRRFPSGGLRLIPSCLSVSCAVRQGAGLLLRGAGAAASGRQRFRPPGRSDRANSRAETRGDARQMPHAPVPNPSAAHAVGVARKTAQPRLREFAGPAWPLKKPARVLTPEKLGRKGGGTSGIESLGLIKVFPSFQSGSAPAMHPGAMSLRFTSNCVCKLILVS